VLHIAFFSAVIRLFLYKAPARLSFPSAKREHKKNCAVKIN
jgi:hypothetical protein